VRERYTSPKAIPEGRRPTTAIPIDIKYLVRMPGVYGAKPRIEGHRIAVHDNAEREGTS
jgi:hypothetical protein